MWPNGLLRILFDEEKGEGAGGGGEGEKKPAASTGKVKLDDNEEYDTKDLKSAISLYKALQDESTGREIIETLAKRAGLLDNKGEIKAKPGETKKETESRVARALKAKLGKDYSQFADSVGPAFDEIFKELMDERMNGERGNATQEKWESAVDKFNDEFETTPEIEESMKDLIEDSPPNFARKGFDAKKYLSRIYRAACEELDAEPKSKNKNKGSARGRGRDADESGAPDIVIREAPKNVSLDDCVEAALKGIRFKKREYS